MGLFAILVVIFTALLVAGIPHWQHSLDWGYGPIGGVAMTGALILFDWL